MVKVGIIGYGKMGRLRHEKTISSGRAIVSAVSDPFKKPEDLPEDIKFFECWQDMITSSEIDAVFICTANVHNKPITIAALQSGKHVFCEKPPCFTAPDMKEIMKVEAASNRKLMYGFNHRLHGAVIKMHDIVQSNEYGRILWMRGRYGKSVDSGYLDTWRADPALSGGGILIDQGIHMLDLFLYLGGPFNEINAMVSSLYWKLPGIEDNVFALLRNSENGRVASLHSTMTQWRHLFSLEVFMERGYMVLNGLKTSSDTYGQEELSIAKNRTKAPAASWKDEERISFKVDTSWDEETDIFFNAIQNGAKIESGNSTHALAVMEVVDRIYANKCFVSETLYKDLNGIS